MRPKKKKKEAGITKQATKLEEWYLKAGDFCDSFLE